MNKIGFIGHVSRAAMLAGVLLAASMAAAVPEVAEAQAYPTSSPVYIPSAQAVGVPFSATGNTTFRVNGGTLALNTSGTFTGLTATVSAAVNSASPVYTGSLTGYCSTAVGQGSATTTISGASTCRYNVAGYSLVKVTVTALGSGTVTFTPAISAAQGLSDVLISKRPTYTATAVGLVPAASATDWLTVTGSATRTVRILRAECSGVSTAAATGQIIGLVRSTADTGGTSTAPTIVPNDSNSPAGTAVVAAYTANPTTGTLVGDVRASYLTTGTAATSAVPAVPMLWKFADSVPGGEQEIVLRGATQQFALNGNGVSYSAGTTFDCSVSWTEE